MAGAGPLLKVPGISKGRQDLCLLLSLPESCGYQLRSSLKTTQTQGPQTTHAVAPVPPGPMNEDVLAVAGGLWQTAESLPATSEAVGQHSQALRKGLGYLHCQATRLLILAAHLCHFQHPSRNTEKSDTSGRVPLLLLGGP